MIEGSLIRLRVWHESDLQVLTALRNDVVLQAQLLARARGSRPEQVLEWLKQRSTNADRAFFVIAGRDDDAPLGFVQISDFDPVDRHAALGICLLREVRGRGLGGEAIILARNYLRDNWNLRKFWLKVRADNAAALRCYQKLGFTRCGLLKEHVFIEGSWHDVVLMEHFVTATD